MKKAKVLIGTSGFYYAHWDNVFYPKEVTSTEKLPYYSQFFNTVEINSSFYRLPLASTIKNWYDRVPKDFLFCLKASRYITHRKRLKDAAESSKLFFERIEPLKEKLGPILFQLPPSFKMDKERLEEFIANLSRDHSYTFEFRHDTWYNDEIYDLLKKNKIALCITDLKGKLSPEIITADFTYLRLHGPTKHAYAGSYGPKKLKEWKDRIQSWQSQNISVYCFFDNDEKGYAVNDAKEIKQLLMN